MFFSKPLRQIDPDSFKLIGGTVEIVDNWKYLGFHLTHDKVLVVLKKKSRFIVPVIASLTHFISPQRKLWWNCSLRTVSQSLVTDWRSRNFLLATWGAYMLPWMMAFAKYLVGIDGKAFASLEVPLATVTFLPWLKSENASFSQLSKSWKPYSSFSQAPLW